MYNLLHVAKVILGIKKMEPNFIDNSNIKDNLDNYISITICADKVLESWKSSLFSYEWLLPDGRIKNIEELPEKEKSKRKHAEEQINNGKNIERPVLGIGMLENVEIGIGKGTLLTLIAKNIKKIEVHIPKSHKKDFEKFIKQ